MKLLIAGDFYISDSYKDTVLINTDVAELFNQADYRLINLEFPVTNSNAKILKTGVHLKGSGNVILPFLKQMNIDAVTLANNHILDYGTQGLLDTMEFLDKNSIGYVGAGKNSKHASEIFYVEKEGHKVAILNFAEKEWSISESDAPGANPLDIIDNVNQIKEARKNADHAIVIIHGGHEYCHYPSPRMVKQFRHYAENGASAIICHHAHCVSGYEIHHGVPVFYGLGNFLFTKKSQHAVWYTGAVLELNIGKERNIKWQLHPVRQSAEFELMILTSSEREKILNDIKNYSDVIANEHSLKDNWLKFIFSLEQQYLNAFNPFNFVKNRKLRAFLVKMGLTKVFMDKDHYAKMLNHMRCEAHYDATQIIIDKYIHTGSKNKNT